MIVKLTHQQARSVQRRVSTFHGEQLVAHRRKHGRTQHLYEMPPVAWRQILDEMLRVCYGPMGGKLDRGVPKSAYAAVRRISDAVRRIENHPALNGRIVQGSTGDIVLGWWERESAPLSPYPPNDPVLKARWLVPEQFVLNGMDCTRWVQHVAWPHASDGVTWSLTPEASLSFVGRSVEAESLPGQHDVEDLFVGHPFHRGAEVVDVEDHRRA